MEDLRFNPENERVNIVPVEELIPEIRPQQTKGVEGVDYRTNKFGDPFIVDFFSEDMRSIVKGFVEGYDQDFSILKERFKDQIVVDLGSDTSIVGYELASLLGAKAYIGVDKYCDGDGPKGMTEEDVKVKIESLLKDPHPDSGTEEDDRKIKNLLEGAAKPEVIPASVIQDDLLSFLKRLPDSSVSIFTFGIDSSIIPDRGYREEVGREIQRVVKPGGGYLTYGSHVNPKELKNLFKELWEDKGEKRRNVSPRLTRGNPGFFVKQ